MTVPSETSLSDDNDPRGQRYPCYRVEGTHRQLGRQHGEQAKEQIGGHLSFMRGSMKLSSRQLRDRGLRFRSLFDQHCPQFVEEIEGLGEGAGISFEDAMAVNIRGALDKASHGGCTAFVVAGRGTIDGQVLIGQNSDMLPAMMDLAYVLHLKPKDKPHVMMWTFGGMIGYSGINVCGVGHFANDLGGGPPPRFGMPHYPLKRLMLECTTLEEVRRLIRRIPLWANGNYVLCDGRGDILDVEATTQDPCYLTDNGAGFIAHTNHFVSRQFATAESRRRSAPDSFARLERMNKLIRSRFGKLSVNDFKTFLRDRDGDPSGICRFAQTTDATADWVTAGMTIASIIAEPAKGRLHVAAGNESETPFELYRMDAV